MDHSLLLCPRDSPGKNTGVGCHFLLQGIFPTQGSNPRLLCLLHWQFFNTRAAWEALSKLIHKVHCQDSLVARWLRLHAYAEGLGSISGRGAKIHMSYGVAKKTKLCLREFPGGPGVRILGFHCHGSGSVPGHGTEIPQAAWHDQKKRKKNPQKTKRKPKCTVFAKEVMTTTQPAIKKLCSLGQLLTQEKIPCPEVVEDLGSEPDHLCVSLWMDVVL